MSEVKTTEELVELLRAERDALVSGKKGLPMTVDPAIAKEIEKKAGIGGILGVEGLGQIAYYHDFREQVQQYQLKHNVSGLTIEEIELNGKKLRYPRFQDQLLLTADDIDVLKAAKERIVTFFLEYIQQGFFYLSYDLPSKDGGEWEMQITHEFIQYFADCMDWADLWINSEGDGIAVVLELGYGDPIKAPYTHGKDSDCWLFEAKNCCQIL